MDDDFDSNEEEALYNQWMNFSSSDQWDRAQEVLGQLLTKDPESAWLHCQMGSACYQLDQNKESEKHFQKAIALAPDDPDPFQGLTYLYLSMGRAGVAEDHCRKALQLDPDDIDNWTLMTHLCIHFEDAAEATKCVQKASALNPHDSRLISLRTQIGAISKGASKLSPYEQIEGYRDVLRISPENDNAHYSIGLVQINELKDYAGAEKSFRAALKIDPQDTANQKALIQALRKRDPILKVLWSPFNFGMWIFDVYSKAWDMKWPIIILIFTWKYFLIGGVVLWLIFFVLFWPMAKVYEALTLVEVHKKMGKISLYTGPLARLHRLSFPLRCLIFGGIFIAFWSMIVWLWQREGARSKIIEWGVLAVTGGVILMIAIGLFAWIRDSHRSRKRRKKNSQIS